MAHDQVIAAIKKTVFCASSKLLSQTASVFLISQIPWETQDCLEISLGDPGSDGLPDFGSKWVGEPD